MAAPCHWKTGCGLCSIVIALVAICMQTLIWWRASHHGMGKPWALISSHETIRSPGTQFARYRGDERTEDNFMQWYYCMIHDSQTKQTWSFAIGTFRQNPSGHPEAVAWVKTSVPYSESNDQSNNLPAGVPRSGGLSEDGAHVSAIKTETVSHTFSMESFKKREDMNVEIVGIPQASKKGKTYRQEERHSLTADEETGTFHFKLDFPEDSSSVDIEFHRIYGLYAGDLSKNGTEYFSSREKECNIENIPYGYDSEVSGTITINNHVYDFSRSPRFRGYIESTWSCMYPQGKEEVDTNGDYPWKWQWLVFPTEDESKDGKPADIALLYGWARLFHPPVGGTVTAAYITVDTPNRRISAKSAELFSTSDDTFPVPLDLEHSTTEKEEALVAFESDHENWTSFFEDEWGIAAIPKFQSIYLETTKHVVTVNYDSDIGSYVRIPVSYRDRNNKERVCSDFRGNGGHTRLTIFSKVRTTESTDQNQSSIECNKPMYSSLFGLEKHDSSVAGKLRQFALNGTTIRRLCWPKEFGETLAIVFDATVPHTSIEFAYHAPFKS